jgi:hypothetical protein
VRRAGPLFRHVSIECSRYPPVWRRRRFHEEPHPPSARPPECRHEPTTRRSALLRAVGDRPSCRPTVGYGVRNARRHPRGRRRTLHPAAFWSFDPVATQRSRRRWLSNPMARPGLPHRCAGSRRALSRASACQPDPSGAHSDRRDQALPAATRGIGRVVRSPLPERVPPDGPDQGHPACACAARAMLQRGWVT